MIFPWCIFLYVATAGLQGISVLDRSLPYPSQKGTSSRKNTLEGKKRSRSLLLLQVQEGFSVSGVHLLLE